MKRFGPTIAIKGAYGLGNFGDDALMVATYHVATRLFAPQNIAFVCQSSQYLAKLLPGLNVKPPSSMNSAPEDLLLYGGGTQFYSFPKSLHNNLRALLWKFVGFARRPAGTGAVNSFLTQTCHVAGLGLGIGPFGSNRQKRRAKKILMGMEYVGVRDCDSYCLCKEWGHPNVSLCTDLCYLPQLWGHNIWDNGVQETPGNFLRIGVIPRDWPHTHEGDSYSASLFQVVKELRAAGKEVKFISFASKYDCSWTARLRAKGERFVAWDPGNQGIAEFVKLLSGFDAFVTARYHGAVFASILGKPVVCIEVEQKLRIVAELLGSGARLWSYPFNATQCLEHLIDIERNYLRAVTGLKEVVETQRGLAAKMVAEFEAYVNEIADVSPIVCS